MSISTKAVFQRYPINGKHLASGIEGRNIAIFTFQIISSGWSRNIGESFMKYELTAKRFVAAFMALALGVSCSMNSAGPGKPDRSIIASESSRMIDQHLERVLRVMEENGENTAKYTAQGTLTGEIVTRGLEDEANGEKYMDFLYYSDRFETVDDVLKAAEGIVSPSSLEEIRTEADKIESRLLEVAEIETRALNETQKAEFYKDIRKLVVKSVVLLTAALVYAAIPNTVFWGKITAATAVSISAGIVASAFMRIIERRNSDQSSTAQTFADWLKEVTTEPTVSWAIAAGVINTGKSLGYSPVTTAIILTIFTVYGIKDDLKPILEKYNFKV